MIKPNEIRKVEFVDCGKGTFITCFRSNRQGEHHMQDWSIPEFTPEKRKVIVYFWGDGKEYTYEDGSEEFNFLCSFFNMSLSDFAYNNIINK